MAALSVPGREVLLAPRFISFPKPFPPSSPVAPARVGRGLALGRRRAATSPDPGSVSRGPSAPRPPTSRFLRSPPQPRTPLSRSFFLSPLQGWTLPGARWSLAAAEPEDGPPRSPPQEMESLWGAQEEGEAKGSGARCPRAPAPVKWRPRLLQVAGSDRRQAKPCRPRGPAVRTARVPVPTQLPRHFPT